MKHSQDEDKVCDVTVLCGITGFGHHAKLYSSALPVLSFDQPAKVSAILIHHKNLLPPGHVVSWSVQTNEG